MAESVASRLAGLQLTVYSAGWCPDCRRLADWLKAEAIPHQYIGIDVEEGAAEFLEASTGKRAIPFIRVNGKQWVRGYHRELPTRFDPELLVTELLAAASA